MVFIVDNDPSVRKSLERLLQSVGLEAKSFASAAQLLQAGYGQDLGCHVLDVRMPGISGFELQARLLDASIRMPVIFLTGQDRAGMEEHAMRLGASAYLRKPVDEEILLDAIRHAMKSLVLEKGVDSS